MNLTLTHEEAELLVRLLDSDLRNMKEETGKTENYDWRVAMKRDEEMIIDIIQRLQTADSTP